MNYSNLQAYRCNTRIKCVYIKCVYIKCVYIKCVYIKCVYIKCVYIKCVYIKCVYDGNDEGKTHTFFLKCEHIEICIMLWNSRMSQHKKNATVSLE